LHRPKVFRAGSLSALPLYRFIVPVPEGQYSDEFGRAIVKEVTEATARAEHRFFEEVSQRVWVFPYEVPDGRWGGRGQVRRLPDILTYLVGEDARQAAVNKLADRRRRTAIAIIDAVRDVMG